MSEYDDIAKINALYSEQAQIDQALQILDDGGTVVQFNVAEKAGDIGLPIRTVDPGQNLIAGVHAALVQRYNAINHELRDLGVTGGPPDHAGGGKP